MSNYTDNPNSCRIDIWKKGSGKWITSQAVIFRVSDYNNSLIHEAFKNAIADAGLTEHCRHNIVTCLEPYHEYCHPISLLPED